MTPKTSLKPSAALLPMPLVLVTCQGNDGPANIITIGYAGNICGKPPMVSISINPTRYSHALVTESGEFVINMPTSSMAGVVDYCGIVSGRDSDKFADSGLTPLEASVVKAPLIAECPVNIECRVVQTVQLGMHDLFIGEVAAVHADQDVLTEREHLDISRLDPLACAGHEYWSLGEKVGRYGYTLKKGDS